MAYRYNVVYTWKCCSAFKKSEILNYEELKETEQLQNDNFCTIPLRASFQRSKIHNNWEAQWLSVNGGGQCVSCLMGTARVVCKMKSSGGARVVVQCFKPMPVTLASIMNVNLNSSVSIFI